MVNILSSLWRMYCTFLEPNMVCFLRASHTMKVLNLSLISQRAVLLFLKTERSSLWLHHKMLLEFSKWRTCQSDKHSYRGGKRCVTTRRQKGWDHQISGIIDYAILAHSTWKQWRQRIGLRHGAYPSPTGHMRCVSWGKAKWKFNWKKLERAIKEPNQVVYADFLIPGKFNTARYEVVLVIMDGYSRFITMHLLKSKYSKMLNKYMREYVLWA